ncbi:hypothetical protein HAX54_016787 [Datura stramonium]|uniref:Uncharacterized protein n=1 Tax=Datura stramonium TaxID=4076 RepID=A0ABS8UL14_DATST|nr:hypothetical protein [Datura stramonium]
MLSRILTHVYPAAGRFAQDKCSIICQDQGVTLIKAKVNRCMDDEFLQQAHNNLDLALDFVQGIEDVDTTGKRSKLVAKKFVMDEVSVSKLRDKLTSAVKVQEASALSPQVEIVTAILWRAQLRASEQ